MADETYYLVIPGVVRIDASLDMFAKILYGEIANKCNLKGFCWATNEALAEIMKCSVRTLQRGIAALQKGGHIVVEVIKNSNGTERRVWLRDGYMADQRHAGAPAVTHPSANGGGEGHDAGGIHKKQSSYNSNEIKQTEGGRASEHGGVTWPWETETFWQAWVEWREYKLKQHRFRYKLRGSEQAALNLLRELAGDSEATAHAVIRQSMANGWKGFFPLKTTENESNRGTFTGGNGQPNGGHASRFDALRNWGGAGTAQGDGRG